MQVFELGDDNLALKKLVQAAIEGRPFVIAKDGIPLVVAHAVAPVDKAAPRRLGFLEGAFVVPDDFDQMCAEEIEQLFYGNA